MNKEDYNEYYIQCSDHYLIPKDVFMELFNEMINWKEESKELNQKYLNAVADYETTMGELQELKKENKILRENAEHNDKVVDKVNWENMLLKKENQELKRKLNEAIHKATEFESEVYELEKQLEENDNTNNAIIEIATTLTLLINTRLYI